MNKNRGSLLIVFLIGIVLLVSLVFVSASISIGKPSSNIKTQYAPGESLGGWINFSVKNENSNSLFSFGGNSITLKALLDKNSFSSGINYNCSSRDCNMTYESESQNIVGSKFNLNAGQTKIVGFNISGDISSISSLILNISSNAQSSCLSQLKIDLFDDGTFEWIADKPSSDYCFEVPTCFSKVYSEDTLTPIISSKTYCQTLAFDPSPGIEVGARVVGSGNAGFQFSILDSDEKCSNTTTSGDVSCTLDKKISEPTNLTICMNQVSGMPYQIYYDNQEPICGFVGSVEYDFSIYGKAKKYDSIGNIVFNSSTIDGLDILGSLDQLYGDCSGGCIIPVTFYSGINGQEITLNSAKLSYESQELQKSTEKLYSLGKTPAIISMGYSLLNLDNSALNVPSSPGKYNLSLLFNNSLVVKVPIEVLSVPIILTIDPLTVPAALETKFSVFASGENITNFIWDFGDNTTLETNTNYAKHKYAQIGTYFLTLSAVNDKGETNKTFSIAVVSPKEALNFTIIDLSNKLFNLKNQLNIFPPELKAFLEKKLDISNIELAVQDAKVQYESVGSNDTLRYVDILNTISSFKLPESITSSQVGSGEFIMDPSKISIADVKTIDSNSSNTNVGESAIFNWVLTNLDVNVLIKVYYGVYGDSNIPLASEVSFTISAKNSDNFYIMVNRPKTEVEISGFSSDFSGTNSFGGRITSTGGSTTIGLVFGDKLSMNELPVYFSPPISKLGQNIEISPCNFNNICEKDKGENWKNCRSDCKPVSLTIIFIIVLLIIIFVFYIILQEWYKKKYEDYLFKDKNDLFNIIHFIENAEKQELDKGEIFHKLSEKKWDKEQLEYAYKKFKGKRTGMYEIPLFKFLENKKVSQQIDMRKNIGMNANLAPSPIKPFIRPMPVRPVFPTQDKPNTDQQPTKSDQDKNNKP